MSDGKAPSSFKGFSNRTTPNPATCGGNWSTDPGNSPPPPPTVGPEITVIAASSIDQSGSAISGNVVKTVVIRTDPGYAPDPGHDGTGTVTSIICTTSPDASPSGKKPKGTKTH
jgi:hypothetical protein